MKVAWIGFGAMGRPMATRLSEHGHTVYGVPRSSEQRILLEQVGARIGSSIAEIAAEADCVVSIVPGPDDVREVWAGPGGALTAMRGQTIGIDMSTVGNEVAIELAATASEQGVQMLDCPVSGGVTGAASGNLTVFTGGEDSAVIEAEPLLAILGKIVRCGKAGSGQRAKLINQAIVALNTYGLCLAYALTKGHGIDASTMFEALTGGAADGRLLRMEWPMLQEDDIETGFAVAHMVKDIDLLLDVVQEIGLEARVLKLIRHAFDDTSQAFSPAIATQALAHTLLTPRP